MSKGEKPCEFFLGILKDWEVCVVDAEGQFKGILAIWNPRVYNFKDFKTGVGILLEGIIIGFDQTSNILNIYAPCRDKKRFWDIISFLRQGA